METVGELLEALRDYDPSTLIYFAKKEGRGVRLLGVKLVAQELITGGSVNIIPLMLMGMED